MPLSFNSAFSSVKGLVGQNLTLESRQGLSVRYADPQRNWTFEVIIANDFIKNVQKYSSNYLGGLNLQTLGGNTDKVLIDEDLIIKCRSASIPSKVMSDISTSFYGQTRKLPGRAEFSNVLNILYEETERQTIKKFMDDWMNIISNSQFRNQAAFSGTSVVDKSQYMTSITLMMYAYNGIQLDKSIVFYNCWPKEVQEVGVSYIDGGDLIKYNIGFSYDFWELVPNTFTDLANTVVSNVVNAGASFIEQKATKIKW